MNNNQKKQNNIDLIGIVIIVGGIFVLIYVVLL